MLTDFSITSRTTTTVTATLALRQVDPILALHRRPPTTLAATTAAVLRVIQTTHLLPDSRTAKDKDKDKDMGATAHNNTLHSRSRGTVMALRLVSVDSRVMAGQLLATVKDHHLQDLGVTANKVRNFFS